MLKSNITNDTTHHLIRGMAKAMDLGNTFEQHTFANDYDKADYNALLSDWYQIGFDMNNAIYRFDNK